MPVTADNQSAKVPCFHAIFPIRAAIMPIAARLTPIADHFIPILTRQIPISARMGSILKLRGASIIPLKWQLGDIAEEPEVVTANRRAVGLRVEPIDPDNQG